MLSLDISDVAIITVKDIDHRCTIVSDISKFDAIHLLKNHALDDHLFT